MLTPKSLPNFECLHAPIARGIFIQLERKTGYRTSDSGNSNYKRLNETQTHFRARELAFRKVKKA